MRRTSGLLACLSAFVVAFGGLCSLTPAAEATVLAAPQAVVGMFPGYNISTVDTTNGGLASAFLEPDVGVGPNGTGSYVKAMNSWQGKANGVINFYDSIDANMFHYWVPTIWDAYHAVPMVSMTMSRPDKVIAGSDDGSISSFVTSLGTWLSGSADTYGQSQTPSRRLYIRLGWEPNGSWYAWSPLYNDTDRPMPRTCADLATREAEYVTAWRHIRDAVMKNPDGSARFSNTQVSWIFSVNNLDIVLTGTGSDALGNPLPDLSACPNMTEALYPGAAYADWVGIDGYGVCNTDGGVTSHYPWVPVGTQTPAQVFQPMVDRLRALAPTKPLGIDEVGTTTASSGPTTLRTPAGDFNACDTPAAKDAWIADYLSYVQSQNIRMSMWFNQDSYLSTEPIDWALFSQQGPQDIVGTGTEVSADPTIPLVKYNAYRSYRTGIAGSYFAGSSATNSQVLTDAQFTGLY